MKVSRRKFLKMSAGAGALFPLQPFYTRCDTNKFIIQPNEKTSTVAAVRGDHLEGMTTEALQTLGGIQSIVHEGETVFIKPNMVTLPWSSSGSCFFHGECTKTEIILAVAEECLKAGASEVIIGDGSQLFTFDWHRATTMDLSKNIVTETQRLNTTYSGTIHLACLETDSPGWTEIPSRTPLGKIAVSSLVISADHVISIAVAKTHAWAQLTLSLKNFIGITPMERYAMWMPSGYWDRGKVLDHSSPQSIGQVYLDIAEAVQPDLAIIDFSIGVEGNGPTSGENDGKTVNMKDRLGSWLILASTDSVAVDATAARVMSHNVKDIKHLQMAHSMGLGQIAESSVNIVGENLDNIKVEWKPAVLRNLG
jgi:uncharacterized protein (DUF362 family)